MSWAKFFSANYFTQWKICHTESFTRTGFYMWLPSSTSSASWSSISCFTRYSKPFSICSLAWCRYRCTSTLHLGFFQIMRDPYHWSYRLPPSQRSTLLWTACSKLRPRKLRNESSIVLRIVHTVRVCEYGTSTFNIRARRGVFIRELHPRLISLKIVLRPFQVFKVKLVMFYAHKKFAIVICRRSQERLLGQCLGPSTTCFRSVSKHFGGSTNCCFFSMATVILGSNLPELVWICWAHFIKKGCTRRRC